MSALAFVKAKTANGTSASRDWLSPLNLHWAGVGALALVNLYLLVQILLLWHGSKNYDANAMADQHIALKTAEVSAMPLRGLDVKVARATDEADAFYRDRLASSDSEMLAELGELTKKAGVRLTRVQYTPATVLAGTAGQLTEVRMDATLSGDYRPLMQMVNSLERDKMFFLINRVTLTGQQSGTVNLRLGLTTYLRPGVPGAADDTAASTPAASAGGAGR